MSVPQRVSCILGPVSEKWRALARRRRGHFEELYRSGRWRHYYSPEDFLARLREAVAAAEQWDRLSASDAGEPLPQDGHAA